MNELNILIFLFFSCKGSKYFHQIICFWLECLVGEKGKFCDSRKNHFIVTFLRNGNTELIYRNCRVQLDWS